LDAVGWTNAFCSTAFSTSLIQKMARDALGWTRESVVQVSTQVKCRKCPWSLLVGQLDFAAQGSVQALIQRLEADSGAVDMYTCSHKQYWTTHLSMINTVVPQTKRI